MLHVKVIKTKDGYRLQKLSDGTLSKITFKTKQAAINSGKAYMKYFGEKPIVRGNRILHS